MEAAAGAGNAGRGKDIENILQAEQKENDEEEGDEPMDVDEDYPKEQNEESIVPETSIAKESKKVEFEEVVGNEVDAATTKDETVAADNSDAVADLPAETSEAKQDNGTSEEADNTNVKEDIAIKDKHEDDDDEEDIVAPKRKKKAAVLKESDDEKERYSVSVSSSLEVNNFFLLLS